MNDFEVKTNGTLYVKTPNGYEKIAECNDIQVAGEFTFIRDMLEYEANLTFKERRRYGEELHGVSSTFIL